MGDRGNIVVRQGNTNADDVWFYGHWSGYSIGDNSYPIVVVDVPRERVFIIEEEQLKDGRIPDGFEPSEQWSFEEFIALELAES